jgi:hypothetical protein
LAGEIPEETKWGQGPWAEVATYLRSIDPYHRLLTCHTGHGRRGAKGDSHVIDFDMVGGNHDERVAVEAKTLAIVATAYAKDPPMPVLVGETCYEGHMQQGFGDVQRRMFWGNMLSGAAGHTYGAAGIWHASVEGDPGCASAAFGGTKVYDWTTWKEGMNYPGATQLGIGKELLDQYPWSRFEPHPEWTEANCIAAGIPGEVRFIYQPRRSIYNWEGTVVKNLEPGVPYHSFYFDPATGRRFDQGTVMYAGLIPPPFKGHTKPLLLEDTFDHADAASWKDYGTPTRRENSRLVGGKGMVTVAETISELDLMASVDAHRDAEAGIILRFHDTENYLVALYSPLLKAIFLHDRKNGQWCEMLGKVDVPGIGPKIHLLAAACGEFAALVLSDGQRTYATPVVKVGNTTAGKTGLWLFQIGERQEFSRFSVSAPRSIRRKVLSRQDCRASSGPANTMRPTCLRPRIGFWCSNDSNHENAHLAPPRHPGARAAGSAARCRGFAEDTTRLRSLHEWEGRLRLLPLSDAGGQRERHGAGLLRRPRQQPQG